MIDLNTGVKFLENSRIRHHVVVRCQIHNHTFTLCWLQTTEEGGLATTTSTGGYLEISTRCTPLVRQLADNPQLLNVRSVRAIDHFFPSLQAKVRPIDPCP